RALVGGLVAQGAARDTLTVLEIDAAAAARIRNEFGIAVVDRIDRDTASAAEAIVLAVKPQHMRQAVSALAPALAAQLVISIAAGIRLADISRWLGNYTRIVRAMPNTPALIRRGITGLFAH